MRTTYSATAWAGFELLFQPWMRRRLDGVHIRGLSEARPPAGAPILMIANHVSWWDGFLLREVHRRLRPEAPFHVVMLERELRSNPVLRLLGAVPLPDSPLGARRLLDGLRSRLRHHPDALIGYFPQGRIWPAHRRPLGFQRGAAWLAERLAPITVLPIGLHLQPLTRPAPAALVAVGCPWVVEGAVDPCAMEREVSALLDALLAHVAREGEAAAGSWAEA